MGWAGGGVALRFCTMCRRWSGVLVSCRSSDSGRRVEQSDLWDSRKLLGRGTHHELPTDFLKVRLACGVERSCASFGDRRI